MKSGFSNLIGRSNVGKSSILNRLIGEKLSIVTDKPQTTIRSMKFIYTDERMQVIFFDNPGYQKPKNKLGQWMNEQIFENIKDADVNLYVVDNSIEIGRLDRDIFKLAISDSSKKALLVNKSDLLTNNDREVLKNKYIAMDLFDEMFFISATTGEGFDMLKDYVYDALYEGPLYYDADEITDVSQRSIMEELLREACFIHLDEEIPHGIYVELQEYSDEGDRIRVNLTIYIERESHKPIIIGKNGNMINRIIKTAENGMSTFMNKKTKVKLNIKIRKNWRKDQILLKRWF